MIKTLTLASTLTSLDDTNTLDLGNLERMLRQINKYIIPLGFDQDPRIPPQGRIISGEIIRSTNGGYSLIGHVELFGNDISQLSQIEGKELIVKVFTEPKIIYDANFLTDKDQEKIYDLKVLLNGNSELEVKRENENLSVFTLAFNHRTGNIYKGLLNEIGKSGIQEMTSLLSQLMMRFDPKDEKLFSFQNTLKHGTSFINTEVILCNPEPKEMKRFFMKSIRKLDDIIAKHYKPGAGIRKIVYQIEKGEFELKYVVMKNGIPLFPKKKS